MLVADNLNKEFDGKVVLRDISFSINKSEKIVLVGPNGAGKSTLLKIMAGIESYEGNLKCDQEISIGYLPQEVPHNCKTVLEYIRTSFPDFDKDKDWHKVAIYFSLFSITNVNAGTEIQELSGGQKNKLLLIVFLLSPYDILLMDEPTNNLDIETIITLQDLIKKSTRAFILISHDRTFLDAIGTKVFSIDAETSTLTVRKGVYGTFLREEELDSKRKVEEYRNYLHEKGRLENSSKDILNIFNKQQVFNADKKISDKMEKQGNVERATKNEGRASILKKRAERLPEVEKPFEYEPLVLSIPSRPGDLEKMDLALLYEDAELGYGDKKVIGPFSLTVPYGKKVLLLGENGAGKTTIIRALMGMSDVLSGSLNKGADLHIADLRQDHEMIDPSMTPVEYFISTTNKSREQALHQLSRVGLDKYAAEQKIESVSPGRRTRILLATLVSRSINTIVLDEPTNHLDIEGLVALEGALSTFNGTIVVVSHDRAFIRKLRPDFVYKVSKDKISAILDYEEYFASLESKGGRLVNLLSKKLDYKL